jgi:hypothetical protein
MDSSVWPKDEIWFLRVCHHISTGLYSTSAYVSCNCAEFCVAKPIVLLSRETRTTTSFLRWFERGEGGGSARSNFCEFLNIVYLLSVSLGTTWRSDKLVQIPFPLLPAPFTRQKALSAERCGTELSYSGWKIVVLSIWCLHTRFDKKKSEVLAATN